MKPPFLQCFGMQAFDSFNAANKTIKSMRRRGKGRDKRGRRPYRCPHCRKWHITIGER